MRTIVNAPDGYVAAKGTLTFDSAKLPRTDWDNQQDTPPLTRISGRFKGVSLSKSGFNTPFNRAVSVEVRCLGPWCSSPPSGKAMLAFLKQSSRGYSIDFGPCHSDAFFEPTRAMLNTVKRCYIQNECPAPSR